MAGPHSNQPSCWLAGRQDKVLTNVFRGLQATDAVELGRFVLLDHVKANAETWFLARCFEHLRRKELAGVLSFSDPQARTTFDGHTVFMGHRGTIYRAHNARPLGRSTPRTLRLLPDARVLSDRAIDKIRSGDQGWRYSSAILERFGAPTAPEEREARADWLKVQMRKYTRTMRHHGNLRFAWSLHRKVQLPEAIPHVA